MFHFKFCVVVVRNTDRFKVLYKFIVYDRLGKLFKRNANAF